MTNQSQQPNDHELDCGKNRALTESVFAGKPFVQLIVQSAYHSKYTFSPETERPGFGEKI